MTDGPIVVVARESDGETRALPARLPSLDVRVMTPTDLSRAGWEFRPGDADGMAIVDGEEIFTPALTAVLVHLPWVAEHDLPHIDPRDRSYVAAEMTAFLLAWLSALRCPVINRPSTTCLAGPLWRPERWARLAAGIGLPVTPVKRCAGIDSEPLPAVALSESILVTVIGELCLGTDDPTLSARLRRLARLAGATALSVRLSDAGPNARFLAASPWTNLTDDEVLRAVMQTAGVHADGAWAMPAV